MVGNPANTNCLIAMNNAKGIDPKQFTAMTRFDHNRALSQLGAKLGKPVTAIKKMTIWGNHSATQYPDLFHCEVEGQNAAKLVNDQNWLENTFIPTVAKRGAAIIEARGLSSAASAANAAISHVHDWVLGSNGEWVTMGVPSDGSYEIPPGTVYGFPCTTKDGKIAIVTGLDIDAFSRERMTATLKELNEEREGVKHLLG